MISRDLAKKIYWNISIVIIAVTYAGAYRRHRSHDNHSPSCRCLTQCLGCAIDGLRGK